MASGRPLLRRAVCAALAAAGLAALWAPGADAARPIFACNGFGALCDRSFDRVALASTHNSMSAASLGWQLPNQQVDIPAQLRRGVHGFLIDTYYGRQLPDGRVITVRTGAAGAWRARTARELGPAAAAQVQRIRARAGGGGLSPIRVYLCHVACELGASRLRAVLRQVRDHLRAHPHNVLTFINEDHIRASDFAHEVSASRLLDYVYRGRPGPWPTLRTMIAARQQVLMLAENSSGSVPWYHVAYDGVLQETPFDWKRAAQLTDPALVPASCRPNRGGRTGSLFLLNHWVATVPPLVSNARRVNAYGPLVSRARTCQRIRHLTANLVAVDLFLAGDLVRAVNALNGVPRRPSGLTGTARRG